MTARILRIFRKDIRRLWPNVLAFWAVMVCVAAASSINSGRPSWSRENFLRASPMLPSLACWLLVVLLIQQERLVGHEQYWLARPFAWKEVLAAKALFLATMVSLPLWICAALYPDPSLQPAPLTAFLILPALAFGTVTRNLGQSLLAFVGTYLALTALSSRQIDEWWLNAPLAPALFVAAVAIAVVLLQYSRRREVLAQCILLAGATGLVVAMRF